MIGVAAVAQVKTFSLNHGFNHDAKVYDDTLSYIILSSRVLTFWLLRMRTR